MEQLQTLLPDSSTYWTMDWAICSSRAGRRTPVKKFNSKYIWASKSLTFRGNVAWWAVCDMFWRGFSRLPGSLQSFHNSCSSAPSWSGSPHASASLAFLCPFYDTPHNSKFWVHLNPLLESLTGISAHPTLQRCPLYVILLRHVFMWAPNMRTETSSGLEYLPTHLAFNLKVSQMIGFYVIFQVCWYSRCLSTLYTLPNIAAVRVHSFLHVGLNKRLNV